MRRALIYVQVPDEPPNRRASNQHRTCAGGVPCGRMCTPACCDHYEQVMISSDVAYDDLSAHVHACTNLKLVPELDSKRTRIQYCVHAAVRAARRDSCIVRAIDGLPGATSLRQAYSDIVVDTSSDNGYAPAHAMRRARFTPAA